MHTEFVQQVANLPRGQMAVVKSRPGSGMIYSLSHGLPAFGVDWIEFRCWDFDMMGEAAFVERLNDIRLCDQVLVLTELEAVSEETLDTIRFNVEHCFTGQGGRAVMVTYK